MATTKVQENWFKNAPGRFMNPDNVFGFQCVDPIKDYAMSIFAGDPSWQSSTGAGNAEDMLWGANDNYFTTIKNDPNKPSQIPQRGDVIVWEGTPDWGNNPFGHIAVVLKADNNGVTVLQQDGFRQVATHVAYLGYYNEGTGMVKGWNRPRWEKLIPDAPKLADYQRATGKLARVAYREQPSSNAKLVEWFATDTIYDFKGYVHGESVSGNDIWFVGRYTGHYSWSGGFTNTGTKGLKDLTPVKEDTDLQGGGVEVILEDYQRATGKSAVVNYRTGPGTQYSLMDELGGQLELDTIYNFSHWTHGESVGGNDIWFKGRYSGGWAWSGGFTSQSTKGLTEEVFDKPAPKPTPETPEPAPAPAPEPEYSFEADLSCVTEVVPARVGHFKADGLPDMPKGVIWHEFNAGENRLNVHIDSVTAWFTSPNNDQYTSAHFAVEGDRIIQLVKLGDRAYHAGAPGNDYVGVETYSGQDAKTIASIKKLRKQIDQFYGVKLRPELHKNVLPTLCGTNIDLDEYEYQEDVPEVPQTPVEPPQEPKGETAVLMEFFTWLIGLFTNRNK